MSLAACGFAPRREAASGNGTTRVAACGFAPRRDTPAAAKLL